MSESDLYKDLAVDATSQSHRLWRNQIGVAKYRDRRGQIYTVPYGIPGPGGSDMIGATVVTITPEMVGKRIAVFTAVEGKSGRKKAKDDQQKFLDAVRALGGFACTAHNVDDYREMLAYEITSLEAS